jgi:hypothetical protein
MAMQLGALRTALLEAGVSVEKAEKAAEEGAGFEARLAGIESRVSVLTWMVGANVGLTIIVIGALVTLSSKLGEIGGQLVQLSRLAH